MYIYHIWWVGCIQVQFKLWLNDCKASAFQVIHSIFSSYLIWIRYVWNFEQLVEWLMDGIDFHLEVSIFGVCSFLPGWNNSRTISMTVERYLNSSQHGNLTLWILQYWSMRIINIFDQLNYKFLSAKYFTFIYLEWRGKRDDFDEIMDKQWESVVVR